MTIAPHHNHILDVLNDAQKRAVSAPITRNMLVLAGAGSGKTRVIIYRIVRLVRDGVSPDLILGVTFTNKAAREMRERLARLVGEQGDRREFMPWMGTFHSICVRLLRMDGVAIGVQRNFVIYDEDDRQSLIKQVMKQLSLTDREMKPSQISSMISNAKNQMQGPDEFSAQANYPFQKKYLSVDNHPDPSYHLRQCHIP